MDTPDIEWDSLFKLNVKGPFWLIKACLPYLLKSKTPSIVLISSFVSYENPSQFGVYPISKTALISMTQILNKELGPKGIRVNCLCPGVIPTQMADYLVKTKSVADIMLSRTSLKRFGTVEEMGKVVAFLCSQDASYISGESIVASGGMRSRL